MELSSVTRRTQPFGSDVDALLSRKKGEESYDRRRGTNPYVRVPG